MIIKIVAYFIFGVYVLALLLVMVYCLIQFLLLIRYCQSKSNPPSDTPQPVPEHQLPNITVQLPVYNEPLVIERLLDCIVKLDYPVEKLQIQVLDDSTDVTRAISAQKVAHYQDRGIRIEHLQRKDRIGFKAGALQHGLKTATGDFIAIFDADFLPAPDFLRRTLPYFKYEQVAVVQTRWGHLNESYSIITLLQAFQLNVHFGIEQSARAGHNHFLQFNGTAGIWRKKAITDAGGWLADTLTEDLDLSYRAQLKGWKIHYCQDIMTPGELPIEMHGLRSQQFRWMKGGAENARKHLTTIFTSSLTTQQKIHATSHLLSSSVFLIVFILSISSVPVFLLYDLAGIPLKLLWPFALSVILLAMVYYTANSETSWRDKKKTGRMVRFIMTFPIFLSLSMGLSWHMSRAVLEGLRGKKSTFIRTPKFAIGDRDQQLLTASYWQPVSFTSIRMEGFLALYFLAAVLISVYKGDYTFIVYHLMLVFGFGGIFILSLTDHTPK